MTEFADTQGGWMLSIHWDKRSAPNQAQWLRVSRLENWGVFFDCKRFSRVRVLVGRCIQTFSFYSENENIKPCRVTKADETKLERKCVSSEYGNVQHAGGRREVNTGSGIIGL